MQRRLIVLEGVDGSGKSTQFRKLCDYFTGIKKDYIKLTFPRYDNPSSALIRMYLGGEFGEDPENVNAYAASTFFACDRYASFVTDWREDYLAGKTVLSDRYTTSNAVHQAAKLQKDELPAFFDWLYDFEFRLLELPKPDIVIYMDSDIQTVMRNIAQRQELTQTQADIHEADRDFLIGSLAAGEAAADHYGWVKLKCSEDGVMRPEDEIFSDLLKYV